MTVCQMHIVMAVQALSAMALGGMLIWLSLYFMLIDDRAGSGYPNPNQCYYYYKNKMPEKRFWREKLIRMG